MPLIVSQHHDYNERYGPENRGGVQQKFAKIIVLAPQRQYSELFVQSLYIVCPITTVCVVMQMYIYSDLPYKGDVNGC